MSRPDRNTESRGGGGGAIVLRLRNGRPVGTLADGVATLRVGPRHFFRRLGGFSIDLFVLETIERHGGRLIEFLDEETGVVECVTLGTFLAHAVRLRDFGWGPKVCCPSQFYERPNAAQLPLLPLPAAQAPQAWRPT